jgi:hypothetical protein
MSNDHEGPNRHIANLIPRRYNYWTNPDFLTVHYYNGNSFRLPPYQHRGPISASNPLRGGCGARNRLRSQEKGETSGICRTRQAETEICFAQRPMDSERGAIAG